MCVPSGAAHLFLFVAGYSPPHEADQDRFIAPMVGPDDEAAVHRLRDRDRGGLRGRGFRPGARGAARQAGDYPVHRGIHERMYRRRTSGRCASYAGFASPEDTNQPLPVPESSTARPGSRWHSICRPSSGATPTTRLCRGEVGRTGVPIYTIEDMRICFETIPLDEVSTSMTIRTRPRRSCCCSTSSWARSQGARPNRLRGTVQNDVLKEYVARGNYIYPPEATMRLTTDIFEYCADHVPALEHDHRSPGYHSAEKGCSGRSRGRIHALERDRLRRGRRSIAASRSTTSRPRLAFLLQLPQQRLPGDRQVPRGAADVGRDRARRPLGASRDTLADDPLPHPEPAASPSTAQQPE